MMITDIHEAVSAARSVRATTLADNTFASPVNQRPIDHGVDGVLHSATKYLGGHSDVVAGAVVTAKQDFFDRIWFVYKMLGPTLGPFEAFLVRRGLKTLPLRMAAQTETAQSLAEFLDGRRGVRVVHYPGLKSFPQHALARKQMSGFGGMLSFELTGGYRAGKKFVESVDVATLAVSLGGAETLVQHPSSILPWQRSRDRRLCRTRRASPSAGQLRLGASRSSSRTHFDPPPRPAASPRGFRLGCRATSPFVQFRFPVLGASPPDRGRRAL